MIRKETVRWYGIRSECVLAIAIAMDCARGINNELRVTSVVDGKHSDTSLHYAGFAFDCTLFGNWNEDNSRQLHCLLITALGPEFDVILERHGSGEPSHVHVEFQPSTESRKRLS